MIIRVAKLEDLSRIQDLILQLGYQLDEKDLILILDAYLSDKNYKVFLVELNDKVIGLVAGSIVSCFVKFSKRLRVEALVVDEKFRGQKIGYRLMKEIEKFGKEAGCYRVDLTTGKRREKDGALRFYQSIGYANEGEMASNFLKKDL